MASPFSQAWNMLKAIPEESLFTEERRPQKLSSSGYGTMPFMHTEQFRHKTLHPAIQGLLNRQQGSFTTGKGQIRADLDDPEEEMGAPPNRVDMYDKHPRQPTILDGPTLDADERYGQSITDFVGFPGRSKPKTYIMGDE